MDNPQCISSEFFLIISIGQMKWYQTKSSIYNISWIDESVNIFMLVASLNGHTGTILENIILIEEDFPSNLKKKKFISILSFRRKFQENSRQERI